MRFAPGTPWRWSGCGVHFTDGIGIGVFPCDNDGIGTGIIAFTDFPMGYAIAPCLASTFLAGGRAGVEEEFNDPPERPAGDCPIGSKVPVCAIDRI